MKLLKTQNFSKAEIERGVGLLSSIKTLVNVLYALLIFQSFLILPRPGDPALVDQSLTQLFSENTNVLLVIVVGLILIIVYWIQFNLLSGNLKRSTPTHAVLSLLQIIFLMIYFYFLRFDIEYDGPTTALQMESVFLALAGFVGAFNWYYAKKTGLTSENISDEESRNILFKILPEPLASAFTFPFAIYGPDIWTIAFLSIIPISYLLKVIRKKGENKPQHSENT